MNSTLSGWMLACSCVLLGLLTACGDAPGEKPRAGQGPVVQGSARIIPEQPTSGDCLNAIVTGSGGGAYQWFVNDQPLPANNEARLCGDFFKRGDRVSVKIGSGSPTSVTIGNSPPRVSEVAVSPREWRSGMAIEIVPTTEDADGDPVELRYQWSINGELDPFLTDPVLPAERNRRGDRIEVLVTPHDGREAGESYRAFVQAVAGSAPKIVSQPPASFEALSYTYQVKAEDPDNDPLIFALDTPPQGMTIDSATGLVSWPLTGVQPGKYEVRIVVRDPEGGEDRQEYAITLGAPK
ncbi:MAG: hypothetical protein FDZ69_01780 [Deltaproteobacteria bacterium]|nr:MAG: hypothetical protein FDZ69_01780 [Deltaproteobacteria bacterium]